MDNRIALSNSTSLPLPSMTVTIERELGRGSNSIVYKGTYPDLQSDALHHILIKELFPLHPQSLVYRDEDGVIRFDGAEDFFGFHRASFEGGNRVHLGLLERSPDGVGGNINTFTYNNTLYTVLNYNGGRSLEDELEVNSLSLEHTVRIMKGLLLSLGDFHHNGFLHLDIAPDNIMILGVGERERVMLIDYNSSMSLESSQTHFSIKPGYSSPEVRSGDIKGFAPASDIYSAAAVFLRLIRGYALLPFEASQRTPPSVSDCPILKDSPQTVISMVKQILFKGLAANPERRYACIEEMLEAFDELDDRIHGVGITHWALWEAGKRTVNHLIKSNTALRYLNNTEELFPIYAEAKDGCRTPIGAHIDGLLGGASHLFITAPGGMGKTTSMLSALKSGSAKYSPSAPAIIYVPLHGRASVNSSYITDRILENLQFKSDVKNYEEARHALRQLLTKTLTKGDTSRPTAVLFLDGLNEVSDGLDSILQEIVSLSKLDGIRIYITSRTEYPLEGFSYQHLSPLSLEEEGRILSAHHLLLPDSNNMRELLRTPIMLSMFLELSRQSNSQPSAKTANELIEAYIDSLIQKEIDPLPEDSPLRLKIDVAVNLVLPKIASRIKKAGRPVGDETLLRETTSCYRLISSPLLIKAFPQWIGHRRTILSGIDSPDDWYDITVRELLWRRLGLLIKDEQGQYFPVHQIVGDYLSDKQKVAQKRITRYRAIKHTIVSAICLILTAATVFVGMNIPTAPPPAESLPKYNTDLSVRVLTGGVTAYQRAGYQYEYIHDLVDVAINDTQNYQSAINQYKHLLASTSSLIQGNTGDEKFVNSLLQSGSVFPWTERSLEKEEYLSLVTLPKNRMEEYEDIVGALDHMMNDYYTMDRYGAEYLTMVSDLIELDADITATLYAISCRDAVNDMISEFSRSDDISRNIEAESLKNALTANPLQSQHLPEQDNITALKDKLNTLRGQRSDLYYNLQSQGAYIIYKSQGGN